MPGYRNSSASPHSISLLVAWLALAVWGFFASIGDADWRLVAYSALVCAVVTIPAIVDNYSYASMWSMVMFVTYLGCGLRSIAVFNRGTSDPVVNHLYLRGRDLEVVDSWYWLYLAGMTTLTLAYMALGASRLIQISTRMRTYEFLPRAPLALAFMASVGFAAFLSYASASGGLNLEVLSAKRSIYTPGEVYAGSFGVQRTINQFSAIALWLAVALFALNPRVAGRYGLWRTAILAILLLNAVLLPMYASTRAQVAYIVLIALVVHFLVSGRMQRGVLAAVGVVGALLMGLLTALREQAQGDGQEITLGEILTSLNEAIVLNQNFTEIFKTVNIMEAVPEQIGFSHGTTVLNYLVAPIPRGLWPEKPIVDVGVEIGRVVYRNDGSSVPPGLIGEFYWAFGSLGVIVGALFIGAFVRRLNDYFMFISPGDAGYSTIYGGAFFTLAGIALGGSLGSAAFSAIIWLVMIFVGLRLAGKWGQVDVT